MEMRRVVILAAMFWTHSISQDKVIVILGSSTASGTGASTYDSSFAGRYTRYAGGLKPAFKVVNLAIGGYSTYDLMPTGFKPPSNRHNPDTAHNMTKAISLKPSAILFALGSNDIGYNYAASEYEANYDTLRNIATRAGVPIWITTPMPRTNLDSTGHMKILAFRKRVLERYAPRAIDFFDSLGAPDAQYIPAFNSGDGTHTNDRGHKILFQRVVAANLTGISTAVAFNGDASETMGWGGATGALPRLILDARHGRLLLAPTRDGRLVDLRGRALSIRMR